jgi:hypothetical protein
MVQIFTGAVGLLLGIWFIVGFSAGLAYARSKVSE